MLLIILSRFKPLIIRSISWRKIVTFFTILIHLEAATIQRLKIKLSFI